MKIRPGEALRNEIILQGNCQTHLFSLQEVRHCKLFQGLFWLGKKVQEKENYLFLLDKKSHQCVTLSLPLHFLGDQ